MSLRLNSIVRDIYFSGLYSSIDSNIEVQLGNEIENLIKVNGLNLLDPNKFSIDSLIGLNSTDVISSDPLPAYDITAIVCIYCRRNKMTDMDFDFFLHPYVVCDFFKNHLFMCTVCICNWKDYRDQAQAANELILENEINEEICCVCSDSPKQLILCSNCPRSFCPACLTKIMNDDASVQRIMKDDNDWTCMPCKFGLCKSPKLSPNYWRKISDDMITATSKKGSATEISRQRSRNISNKGNHKKREIIDPINAVPQELEIQPEVVSGKSDDSKIVQSKSVPVVENKVVALRTNRSRPNKYNDQTTTNTDAMKELQIISKEESKQLPPVDNQFDELYYFATYVDYYNNICDEINNDKYQWETDDSCFLCKDGGDLVECEWTKRINKKKGPDGTVARRCSVIKCQKVYHDYCLDFKIGDHKWICPRHFCDICASAELAYVCIYCSMSICGNCEEELVKQVSQS
jgi:hypothetical protein